MLLRDTVQIVTNTVLQVCKLQIATSYIICQLENVTSIVICNIPCVVVSSGDVMEGSELENLISIIGAKTVK